LEKILADIAREARLGKWLESSLGPERLKMDPIWAGHATLAHNSEIRSPTSSSWHRNRRTKHSGSGKSCPQRHLLAVEVGGDLLRVDTVMLMVFSQESHLSAPVGSISAAGMQRTGTKAGLSRFGAIFAHAGLPHP